MDDDDDNDNDNDNNNNSDTKFLTKEDFGGHLTKFKNLLPIELLNLVAAKASAKEGWLSHDDVQHYQHLILGVKRVKPRAKPPINEEETNPLPAIFLNKINSLGGSEYVPKLLCEKKLYKTDIDAKQYKLNMPIAQCNELGLRRGEMGAIPNVVHEVYEGMEVVGLTLKKYRIRGVQSYIFGGTSWNSFVLANGLKLHDLIQVWHFRLRPNSKLCFAFVKLASGSASGSGSASK